jgi:hypothetical protein
MGRVRDALALVVGAPMASPLFEPVEDSDLDFGGDQQQALADLGRRDCAFR